MPTATPTAAPAKHPFFTKIDATGAALPDDASTWFATRVIDGSICVDVLNAPPGKPMSQADCEKTVSAPDLGGFTDWRLPTVREAECIVDRTRSAPAVDPQFFPNIQNDWYWTSEALAGSSSSAWYVHFYYGYVYTNLRNGHGFALAVRRPGQ